MHTPHVDACIVFSRNKDTQWHTAQSKRNTADRQSLNINSNSFFVYHFSS